MKCPVVKIKSLLKSRSVSSCVVIGSSYFFRLLKHGMANIWGESHHTECSEEGWSGLKSWPHSPCSEDSVQWTPRGLAWLPGKDMCPHSLTHDSVLFNDPPNRPCVWFSSLALLFLRTILGKWPNGLLCPIHILEMAADLHISSPDPSPYSLLISSVPLQMPQGQSSVVNIEAQRSLDTGGTRPRTAWDS